MEIKGVHREYAGMEESTKELEGKGQALKGPGRRDRRDRKLLPSWA